MTNYPDMINYNTSEWRKRRLKFIKERGENLHCHLCDKKAFGPKGGKKFRIHVHHMNYDHLAGTEPDTVLRILCPSCHDIVTIISHRGGDSVTINDLWRIIWNKLNTN